MEHRKPKSQVKTSPTDIEELIVGRYDKLVKWGELLASGDHGTAREIVHDLCLYLMLTKPDFREVSNLDGYFYTSLRHVYLSRMARLSRETLRFVSIGDFDSFGFAMASSDLVGSVDLQNDLREICSYAVWRKDTLKGFSYFILHFFHGYFPREIADLACLPVAAIYNKLKSSRTELRSHLAGPDKVRSIKQETPPRAILALSPVSSAALFMELRQIILQARSQACLPEGDLLAYYLAPFPSPVPCALLSHIVSCERCLALADRHLERPTLKDRDALDGFDRALNVKEANGETADDSGADAMLRSLRRQRDRIYHHRPGTLSIATNGKIIAFHDVQGAQSRLAARIERPESIQFIEVFSEQHVRLALLPVGEAPPDGPHSLAHQILLSDERWLKLSFAFDGLGLQSAVMYFDHALPAAAIEDAEEASEANPELFATGKLYGIRPENTWNPAVFFKRIFQYLQLSPVFAWSFVIACVVCGSGYFAYRHTGAALDANAILDQSVSVETASLRGNAEHEVLSLQETSSSGHVLHGVVDLWKDGESSRYIRRLYDDRHNLIATEWKAKDGGPISTALSRSRAIAEADRELAANDSWKQDLSPSAFRSIARHAVNITNVEGGYRLSTEGSSPRLESAVLILDRRLSPVSETLRIRSNAHIQEVRLVLTTRERQPSATVRDRVFLPADVPMTPLEEHDTSPSTANGIAGTESQLVPLEIAVLYQLNQMGADIGEPIEVARTPDGRIRIHGSISDQGRRAEIISRLNTVPSRQLLSIQLNPASDARAATLGKPTLVFSSPKIYDVTHSEAPADTILLKFFIANGWSEDRAKAAAMQFSQAALGHARRAHQHAYALDRLGVSFSAADLHSVSATVKQEWTEMASGHALSLEQELRSLHDQLQEIASPADDKAAARQVSPAIESLPSFGNAVVRLLHETQELDRSMGITFASSTSKTTEQPNVLLSKTANAIPLQDSIEMVDFMTRLSTVKTAKDGQNGSTSLHLQGAKR